jgi:hypothetical protein
MGINGNSNINILGTKICVNWSILQQPNQKAHSFLFIMILHVLSMIFPHYITHSSMTHTHISEMYTHSLKQTQYVPHNFKRQHCLWSLH